MGWDGMGWDGMGMGIEDLWSRVIPSAADLGTTGTEGPPDEPLDVTNPSKQKGYRRHEGAVWCCISDSGLWKDPKVVFYCSVIW